MSPAVNQQLRAGLLTLQIALGQLEQLLVSEPEVESYLGRQFASWLLTPKRGLEISIASLRRMLNELELDARKGGQLL